jgi:hypothetical protein
MTDCSDVEATDATSPEAMRRIDPWTDEPDGGDASPFIAWQIRCFGGEACNEEISRLLNEGGPDLPRSTEEHLFNAPRSR